MYHRLTPVLICWLVLVGCGSTAPETKADAKTKGPDPSKFRDDPVVVSDGSVRFFFRSAVFLSEQISPVYGCCLATPAVRGKKEVRIYRPSSAGATSVSLAQTLPLNEADVLQFYLERQGETGWIPVDNDKFPTPQFVFFRRDLSSVDALKEAQYADYGLTGRTSWIVSSEMDIKPSSDVDALGKSLSMRRQYEVKAKSKVRLGRVVVRRADNSSDTVQLGNGCSAIEICTGPELPGRHELAVSGRRRGPSRRQALAACPRR